MRRLFRHRRMKNAYGIPRHYDHFVGRHLDRRDECKDKRKQTYNRSMNEKGRVMQRQGYLRHIGRHTRVVKGMTQGSPAEKVGPIRFRKGHQRNYVRLILAPNLPYPIVRSLLPRLHLIILEQHEILSICILLPKDQLAINLQVQMIYPEINSKHLSSISSIAPPIAGPRSSSLMWIERTISVNVVGGDCCEDSTATGQRLWT